VRYSIRIFLSTHDASGGFREEIVLSVDNPLLLMMLNPGKHAVTLAVFGMMEALLKHGSYYI
jgi:hypothetical protein